MSYLHISNLYQDTTIFLFKECYCTEKIHGSSAHVSWRNEENKSSQCPLRFFASGAKHDTFVALFDQNFLTEKFVELGIENIMIYGEVYGGKMMKMSGTYGKDLKFIAFEVKIDNHWLSVPQAEEIVLQLGLDFVYYEKISTDILTLDKARDTHSIQAIRNGLGEGKLREGVVLRPLIELRKNNGTRIIVKHKNEKFQETKTPREVLTPEKLKVITDANEIAEEWVVPNRLNNVLSKIPALNITKMGEIILAMVEDIKREGEKEIIWSKIVQKAISKKTAQMTKEYFNKILQSHV